MFASSLSRVAMASRSRVAASPSSRFALPRRTLTMPRQQQTTLFTTEAAAAAPKKQKHPWYKYVTFYGGKIMVLSIPLQFLFGNANDFYEYRFITDKNPDDIASFYGGEEFMELFCVMPIVGQIMMRGGEFDDEGTVHTAGMPGTLLVSMVFSDETDEETDKTLWFNKRERFKDVLWGFKCWDMVTNFGFQTLPDGRVECYHTGEYFHGSVPPISLILRLVFTLHAQYVGMATAFHIKHHAFDAETEEEEEMEELSRTFFLWNLLKNHINPWGAARNMPPRTKQEEEDEEEEEEEMEDDDEEDLQKELTAFTKRQTGDLKTKTTSPGVAVQSRLSIKKRGTLAKIEQDIKLDRAIARRNSLTEVEKVHGVTAYRRATVAAHNRMTQRKTLVRHNTAQKLLDEDHKRQSAL